MTPFEKKKYDVEVKTYSTMTMDLPENIFLQFRHIKSSASLYDALKARSLGNTQESKKCMLKFKYKKLKT